MQQTLPVSQHVRLLSFRNRLPIRARPGTGEPQLGENKELRAPLTVCSHRNRFCCSGRDRLSERSAHSKKTSDSLPARAR